MARFSTLRTGLLLAVASGLVGLLLVEFAFVPLVLFKDVERSMALMGFYAWPGILIDDTRINAQGFTGYELPDPADDRHTAVRILTLGGSTLFNRRMTERMTESWQDVFPEPPEVVGGALRTHTTRASVIKYTYHFSKYHFDYVLLYHGVNDLWANNVDPAEFEDDYSHQNPWGRRNFILDHSMLARLAYNQMNPGTGPIPGPRSNAAGSLAARTFERNLRTLVTSVRAQGGKPVLMTFAWHIPSNYDFQRFQAGELSYANPERYDYCPVELWGQVDDVRAGLALHNAVIRRLASELEVDLVDQYARLSSDPANFGDPVHLSEAGTDRFIAGLTEYFQAERRVDPALSTLPPPSRFTAAVSHKLR